MIFAAESRAPIWPGGVLASAAVLAKIAHLAGELCLISPVPPFPKWRWPIRWGSRVQGVAEFRGQPSSRGPSLFGDLRLSVIDNNWPIKSTKSNLRAEEFWCSRTDQFRDGRHRSKGYVLNSTHNTN